jgi:hypothetical protein
MISKPFLPHMGQNRNLTLAESFSKDAAHKQLLQITRSRYSCGTKSKNKRESHLIIHYYSNDAR